MLSMDEVQKLIWPDWELLEILGRGTFGVVYRARKEQQGVKTDSAIKVVLIPKSEEDYNSLREEGYNDEQTNTYIRKVVDDCVNEIKLMDSLKGTENIVNIEDYKVVELVPNTRWCIIIRMELLTPLTQYKENHPLEESDIIRLGIDICKALQRCRARNVIHRDIKIANIFVNEFGDFKLGDFGIAKRLDEFQNAQTRLGTLNFLAPEIYQGRAYDSGVDIYSLGMVLYMLGNRGRLPFLDIGSEMIDARAKEDANMRRLHGEKLPMPAQVSTALGEIICKACAYEPSERYQHPAEMQEALQRLLSGTGENDVTGQEKKRIKEKKKSTDAEPAVQAADDRTEVIKVYRRYSDAKGNTIGYKRGWRNFIDIVGLMLLLWSIGLYQLLSSSDRFCSAWWYVPPFFAYLLLLVMNRVFIQNKNVRILFKGIMWVFVSGHMIIVGILENSYRWLGFRSVDWIFGMLLLLWFVLYLAVNCIVYVKLRDRGDSQILSQIRMSGEKGIRNTLVLAAAEMVMTGVYLYGLVCMRVVYWNDYGFFWESLLVMDATILIAQLIGVAVQRIPFTREISRKLQWINHIFVIVGVGGTCIAIGKEMWVPANDISGIVWIVSIVIYVMAIIICILHNIVKNRKMRQQQQLDNYIDSCIARLQNLYGGLEDSYIKQEIGKTIESLQNCRRKYSAVTEGIEKDIVNNIVILESAVEQGASRQQLHEVLRSLQYLIAERDRMLKAI